MMVPLSVLEAAREDLRSAREDAAREARISDERVDVAKAHVDEVKTCMRLLELLYAQQLAEALFERDEARGEVSARALVEEAAAHAWRAWARLDAEGRQKVCPGVTKAPFSVTEQLKVLLGFPAVAAYLQVVEEDNGLARGVLAKSVGVMYHALCAPLPARPAGAQQDAFPPPREFSAIGESGRIAFAALAAFSGRNVGKYHPYGVTVPVVLRVKPMMGLSATLERIRGSAKLPTVGASVELGMAGGGTGPFGDLAV
jgi:hypothetical protein